MTRHAIGVLALAAALIAPSLALAYFPPTIGNPPPTPTPPDPFVPPGGGGLGEPEPPPPPSGPSVQTPEPASVVTLSPGLALWSWDYSGCRKKRERSAA